MEKERYLALSVFDAQRQAALSTKLSATFKGCWTTSRLLPVSLAHCVMTAANGHSLPDIGIGVMLRLVVTLSECQWRTALQLRLVSWQWYNAINFLMLGSLTLTPSGKSDTLVEVRSPSMKLPPALRQIHPDCWASWHPGYHFTAVTIAVSVVGFFPPTCNLRLLQKALPSLLVLRMCPTMVGMSFLPYVPLKAPVTVFFARPMDGLGDTNPSRQKSVSKLSSVRPGMHDLMWTRAKAQALLPVKFPNRLSPKVSKIVINTLNLSQRIDLGSMYNLPSVLPKHVKEVDIVVPCYMTMEQCISSSWNTKTASANLAALLTSPHTRYNIVGLEEIKLQDCERQLRSLLFNDLWHEDRKRSQKDTNRRETLEEVAVRYVRVTEILRRVEMVSLDEYKSRLGTVGDDIARILFELTFHWGIWSQDVIKNIKAMESRSLGRFPNFEIAPEVDNSAHTLFEYLTENGLF